MMVLKSICIFCVAVVHSLVTLAVRWIESIESFVLSITFFKISQMLETLEDVGGEPALGPMQRFEIDPWTADSRSLLSIEFQRPSRSLDIHPQPNLPLDILLCIMEKLHLRELAQVAHLCKDIHRLYVEREKERDLYVADLLNTYFTTKFRHGLADADTRLPRDLVVDFRVRRYWF